MKQTMDAKQFQLLKRIHHINGECDLSLAIFGYDLAKREGYKSFTPTDGIEAIRFYLMHKFNWLPSQVRGMSHDDIRFVLSEEMQDWIWPEEVRALKE